MNTPAYVVIQYKVELAKNRFTTLAIINPMSAMYIKRPKDEISRLINVPNKAKAPNIPAETKKVTAMLSVV